MQVFSWTTQHTVHTQSIYLKEQPLAFSTATVHAMNTSSLALLSQEMLKQKALRVCVLPWAAGSNSTEGIKVMNGCVEMGTLPHRVSRLCFWIRTKD